MGPINKKVKSFFFDIISFGSPQAIAFNLFSILFILAVLPAGDLSYLPIRCVFKYAILPLVFRGNCPTSGLFADCECPFCGITRGMSRWLKGDFKGAIEYNILVPLVFAVIVVVLMINLVKCYKIYWKTGEIYPLENIYKEKAASKNNGKKRTKR